MANRKGGFIGQDGLNAPDQPTGVSASAGDAQATVSFTAPSDVGGSAVTGYVATSDDGVGATGSSSPITVTGLTNGTSYTFNVWAINAFGWSSPSDASGSVTPFAPVAVFFGGYDFSGSVAINNIDYVTIATTGNSSDWGDLTAATRLNSAAGSGTRGINANGYLTNVISYITYGSTGDAIDFGDMSAALYTRSGASNDTRMLVAGGFNGPTDDISYITIATLGNSTTFGTLSQDRGGAAGMASSTRAVFGAGRSAANLPTGTATNVIDYVTIATTGNAVDFGDNTYAVQDTAGCSSSTRGLLMGGTTSQTGAASNVVTYITIASTGNATDFGDLNGGRQLGGAASSELRALLAGGSSSSVGVNTIDYFTIATTGNATDFGDLTSSRGQLAGTSSAHGGLQ